MTSSPSLITTSEKSGPNWLNILPNSNIRAVVALQNTAVCLVFNQPKRPHVTPLTSAPSYYMNESWWGCEVARFDTTAPVRSPNRPVLKLLLGGTGGMTLETWFPVKSHLYFYISLCVRMKQRWCITLNYTDIDLFVLHSFNVAASCTLKD